jgi:hypothetical protein
MAFLPVNPATMSRFVAWLGNLGTIKASNHQPYMSAVNNFYMDHGRESVALGDLVARVRRGLVVSHATITPTLIRVLLPSAVVYGALTRAYELRTVLQLITTDGVPRTKIEPLQACIATIVLFVFFGGVEQELSALTVTSPLHNKVKSSCTIAIERNIGTKRRHNRTTPTICYSKGYSP